MGIRFFCPNGHKLNVKSFQAGQRGICPVCGTKVQIPDESTRPSSKADPPNPADPQPSVPIAISDPELVASFSLSSQTLTPEHQVPLTEPEAASPKPQSLDTIPEARSTKHEALGTNHPQPQIPAAVPALPLAPGPTFSASPPDPLNEAPDAVWYVRPPAGGQYGPAAGPIMRTWIDEGRVPPDALVWREGWTDWQQASAVFSQLRQDGEKDQLEAIRAKSPPLPRTAAAGYHGQTRRHSNATNITIIVVLVLAVIILFAVLLWVLMNGPGSAPTAMSAIGPGLFVWTGRRWLCPFAAGTR